MRALTPPQRRFAMAAVMYPLAKDWQIAKAAGYSDKSHGSLRVAAHRNFHDEKVLAAIRECADKQMRSTSMLAMAVLERIARTQGHRDEFKAAALLAGLNRFTVDQNINVKQTVTDQSGKAIMERIERLAAKHGLDASKLLGKSEAPVVIDAEFEEVEK